MLYYINPEQQTPEELKALLEMHPEIKFVSFMGVDFAGNDTDEKVPINLFIEDINSFLEGMAAQTDGSSVVLPGIATLNNARVDMKVDKSVNWYIDYNYEHFDAQTGKMVGTLRIPCFLIHNEIFVDSRSILQNSLDYVEAQMLEMFKKHPQIAGLEHVDLSQIEKLVFTCATELEFWVKSPREDAPIEALSSSQMMQEQYWQRTRGNVRTALEQTIEMMEAYGLEPEMGHKECGGVRGQIDGAGHMTHVMEQLEVDWKFNVGLQTADNELLARIIVKEVFRMNGLEVSFQAKPIPGVAGSGEHTHVGIAAKLKNGKMVNLFAPGDMKADFLSAIGYGSMMGLLKNYEVINPFISATIDSLNRLKPGFEAPVCIVTSLGISPQVPSRNRTILAGLIRDIDSPMATRIEMRSPNPYTNTYIAIAAFYLAMWDGIKACVESGKNLKELEAELSKKARALKASIWKKTANTAAKMMFLKTSARKNAAVCLVNRLQLCGKICAALINIPKRKLLLPAAISCAAEFIDSFAKGALVRWQTELLNRIIPEFHAEIVAMKCLHDTGFYNKCDDELWEKIAALRVMLAKDSVEAPCIFTMIRDAFSRGDFDAASKLKLEMVKTMEKLRSCYHDYKQNIID